MTLQEQFDKMVNHLRKQGERSINDSDGCMYRGNNGLMCAVGCLIPDDIYTVDMEGQPADYVINKYYLDLDMTLCNNMQYVHDHYGPDKWEEFFEKVAKELDLQLPPMTKV